jgi:hypothetical protein
MSNTEYLFFSFVTFGNGRLKKERKREREGRKMLKNKQKKAHSSERNDITVLGKIKRTNY